MLFCDEKIFYVGITNEPSKRIKQHKNKESFFTKKFSQIRPVYCEKYPTKYQAAEREKQLKGWSKTKKQMLIDGKLGTNVCTELSKLFGE
ncbi:MAG TPA: GIY-YIG nuclease family protein, partial [bacterium]|nr:GIY-YIG nuclease family protein [bacterium]